MTMERFKRVMGFLFLWLMAWITWTFAIRCATAHWADKAWTQGLALDTIA